MTSHAKPVAAQSVKTRSHKIKEDLMSKAKTKKVYACRLCNAYMTKDADEATPLCCGKGMDLMDELSEDEIYEEKESSGGR